MSQLPAIQATDPVSPPSLPATFNELYVKQTRIETTHEPDRENPTKPWPVTLDVCHFDYASNTIYPGESDRVRLPNLLEKMAIYSVVKQTFGVVLVLVGWLVREKQLQDKIEQAEEGTDTSAWETQLAEVQGKLSMSLEDVLTMLASE